MPNKDKRPRKVPPAVQKALLGEVTDPRLEELVGHFFHAAGGTKSVAKILYEEFIAAKPGSLIRSRILDMILRATKFAQERSPNVGDFSLLSEDDLERVAEDVCERIASGARG